MGTWRKLRMFAEFVEPLSETIQWTWWNLTGKLHGARSWKENDLSDSVSTGKLSPRAAKYTPSRIGRTAGGRAHHLLLRARRALLRARRALLRGRELRLKGRHLRARRYSSDRHRFPRKKNAERCCNLLPNCSGKSELSADEKSDRVTLMPSVL